MNNTSFMLIVLTQLTIMTYTKDVLAQENCEFTFQVNSDQGKPVHLHELKAFDTTENTTLNITSSGSIQIVQIPKPDLLYKKVEINVAGFEDKNAKNSIALYNIWPCLPRRNYTITISERTGSATEVKDLWDNKSLISPVEFHTAAIQYAQALSTAEKRYDPNKTDLKAWDLISTYIALRAFNNLNKLSPVPLAHSVTLGKIALWHEKLLNKIKIKNADVIYREGSDTFSERKAVEKMYKNYWENILRNENSEEKLLKIRIFNNSIKLEMDYENLLTQLNLNEEIIINSTSFFASQIADEKYRTDKQLLDALKEHIIGAKSFISKKGIENVQQTSADVAFLENIYGI